jgi:predicted Zn-dependent protease
MNDSSFKGRTGYFERSRGCFVTLKRYPRQRLSVFECENERGRLLSEKGEKYLFSGPPPPGWNFRLDAPEPTTEAASVEDALVNLAQSWPRISLNYSSVVTHRVRVNNGDPVHTHALSRWAVIGSVTTSGPNQSFNIAWSGRGNGLECLSGRAAELQELATAFERADPIDEGRPEVVLRPAAAAVLLHEAVGHSVEATLDLTRQVLDNGRYRIASECLTLSDDPMAEDGPAHYEFDDENVRSLGAMVVVNQGRLTARLHSRATAAAAGTLPTGNGRAASAFDEVLPRMSNLICKPGESPEAEMIDRVRQGLLIHRLADGVNNGGAVKAKVILAERIEAGQRSGKFVTGGQISEGLDVLLGAVEVGNNPTFNSNALCGKAGQLLFDVGTCAPSIRMSSLRIVV